MQLLTAHFNAIIDIDNPQNSGIDILSKSDHPPFPMEDVAEGEELKDPVELVDYETPEQRDDGLYHIQGVSYGTTEEAARMAAQSFYEGYASALRMTVPPTEA